MTLPPRARRTGEAEISTRRESGRKRTSAEPPLPPPAGSNPEIARDAVAERSDLARLQAESRALAAQNSLLKQVVAVYDQMAAVVLQGEDIGAVTGLLAELIQRPVRIFDPTFQVLAAAVPAAMAGDELIRAERIALSPADPQTAQILANLIEGRRPMRIPAMPDWEMGSGMVIAPIAAGEEVLGYLTILEPNGREGDDFDPLVAQHAATVYALTLTRERLSADVTNRLREDLLEGLLLGQASNAGETKHRALLLGYDPASTYRVVVIAPEGSTTASTGIQADSPAALSLRRRILDAAVQQVARVAKDSVAVARRDEVVILVPEPAETTAPRRAPSTADLAETLLLRLRRLFPQTVLTAGISGLCRDAADLAQAYAQARRTLLAAEQFGRRGGVTSFEELGIYRLLFQVPDPAELRGFADQVLGALVAYDERHDADFLHTLAAFLHHRGSLQGAARELVVHVNTVSYRLQRIQEITGLNLDDAEDRLVAQVALKILQGLEGGQP